MEYQNSESPNPVSEGCQNPKMGEAIFEPGSIIYFFDCVTLVIVEQIVADLSRRFVTMHEPSGSCRDKYIALICEYMSCNVSIKDNAIIKVGRYFITYRVYFTH